MTFQPTRLARTVRTLARFTATTTARQITDQTTPTANPHDNGPLRGGSAVDALGRLPPTMRIETLQPTAPERTHSARTYSAVIAGPSTRAKSRWNRMNPA